MLDKVTMSTIRDTGMVGTHAYNCANRRCVVVNQNTNRNHLLSNYPTTRTSLCCLKRLNLFTKSQTLFQQTGVRSGIAQAIDSQDMDSDKIQNIS